MSTPCYAARVMSDDDRAELRARHARISEARAAAQAALKARNEYMRELWAKYGRGIVAEIARAIPTDEDGKGMTGQTVSRIIHRPSPSEGSTGGAWRSR